MTEGKSSLTIVQDVLKNIKTPPSLAFQVRLLSAVAAGLSGDWEGAEMVLRERVAPLVELPRQRMEYNLLCAVAHMQRNRPEEAKPLLEGLPTKVARYIHPKLSPAALLKLSKYLDVKDALLWLLEEFLGQEPQVAYAVYRFLRVLPGFSFEERMRVDTAFAGVACMCRRYKVARRISMMNLSKNKSNKFNSAFYAILSICDCQSGNLKKGVKNLIRAFKIIESDEEAFSLCKFTNSVFRYLDSTKDLILASAAVALCKNKNYRRATAKAQAWRGFVFLMQGKHMLAERAFRDAHQALVDLQDTSELRVDLGSMLGYLCTRNLNYELAEFYLRDSLICANEFCYDEYIPIIKKLIAECMFYSGKFKGEYNIFVNYIKYCIKYFKENKEYDEVSWIYYIAARACLEKYSYPKNVYKAVKLYLNAYHYSLNSGNYENIKIVFRDMRFILRDVNFVKHFIAQYKKKDEVDKIGVLYQIISKIYYKNNLHKNALKCAKLALYHFNLVNDNYGAKRAIKYIEIIKKNLGKSLGI